MDIGHTLAKLRNDKGIFQKELAAQLKLSIGTISNYEKGIHSPDLVTLCKLADYFGVTTDYLLGRTSYPYNPEKLNHELVTNYTVADMINTSLELSPKDIHSMIDYLDLLKLRSLTESSGQ